VTKCNFSFCVYFVLNYLFTGCYTSAFVTLGLVSYYHAKLLSGANVVEMTVFVLNEMYHVTHQLDQ